jgi:L-methionine (R)-S-oxide reductase
MAESLFISVDISDKSAVYAELIPQIEALLTGEKDPIATFANAAAAIQQVFQHHWTGFYLVRGEELVLGPFQGPIACTRIAFGKGVCGTAWKENRTVVVDDVEQFPGHIACSALSKSEIVLPISSPAGETIAVLDIDSAHLAAFDEADQLGLEQICRIISAQIFS